MGIGQSQQTVRRGVGVDREHLDINITTVIIVKVVAWTIIFESLKKAIVAIMMMMMVTPINIRALGLGELGPIHPAHLVRMRSGMMTRC